MPKCKCCEYIYLVKKNKKWYRYRVGLWSTYGFDSFLELVLNFYNLCQYTANISFVIAEAEVEKLL